jgi:hypothetical protein
MKSFTVTLSVFILLIGAVFSVSTAARTHYIRYGDTLWDLSIRYYSNPFYWENILNANPSIEGVELLQPGSELIIPDIYGNSVTSISYGADIYGSYTTAGTSSRPLLSRLLLETAGMVTSDPPDPVSYIFETDIDYNDKYGEMAAYPGDMVAIDIGQDQGVEIDRVYKIYETGEEVRHPQTGVLLGNVIRVAGVCRVTDTVASSSVAIVEHAYMPVNEGDYLVPYTSSAPVPVSASDVIEDLDAYVIAFQDPDVEKAYSYDVIYIDKGASSGLHPGDIFNMFKYGQEISSPSGRIVETPDIPVSELIILDTTQSTSSVLIFSIASSDLVRIGDKIELVKKQN